MRQLFNLLLVFVPLIGAGCANSAHQLERQSPALWSEIPAKANDGSWTSPVNKQKGGGPYLSSPQIETVNFETQNAVPADSTAPNYLPSTVPHGDDAEGWIGGLTLEALEQMALENNPSIRQASAAVCKAVGNHTQVGLRPNPTIGYSGQEIGNDSAAGQHGMFVSQTIVRGDKLALNRQVISHDIDFAHLQVETQRLRVLNDIRIQFYGTLAAQRRLQLARQFREIAAQGVEISKQLVEAQEAARPDVLQSEIQLGEVHLAIQQAEFELQGAWNELVAIAGLPNPTLTPLIGKLSIPIVDRDAETEFSQIVAASPLLSAAYARVNRAKANLHRQRAQPIPNVNAQLGVFYDDSTGNEFANIQLSVPIPCRNKNQGNIQAAHADYYEATQNVQRIQMQIRRDVARVMREYQVAMATVNRYESFIMPKSKESLALLLKAQEAGEFDFLRVLTARRSYFDVQNRYVTALSQLATANAKMDGLLLFGGLSNVGPYDVIDGLRGQALSGQ